MELKDEINRLRKEKWFEVAFSIEVLAINKDVAETSLSEHVEKLSKESGIFVYEKKFGETQLVKNPMRDIEEAYSTIVSIKLFAKNLSTVMHMVMLYGPSSVEILGPDKKELDISEIQHVANNLASIVHQFAAAGVGGIVITPEKK